MTASSVHVERLHARYFARPSAAERRRLDGVLRAMVDDALEPALERAGIDLRAGELCVRDLQVPVGLELERRGDSALAATWAQAIAAGLARRIALGGPGVVRYGSRRQALTDLALCVADGESGRQWAWRSLGLWPAAGSDGAAALTTALAGDPPAVAPVLCEVAAAGRLPALARRLAPDQWRRLAVAALRGAGAGAAEARAALDAPTPPPGRRPEPSRRRSRIAASMPATSAPAAAVAALALAETAPEAVAALGPELPGAVAAVAAGLSDGATPPVPPTADDAIAPDAAEAPGPGSAPAVPDRRDPLPLPERRRAPTAWGGLPFALHAVAGLALATGFAQRELPVPAALHAVALELVPAEPADPAALAFAGLPPDAEPPGRPRELPPGEVADAAEAVRVWLAARLDRAPHEADLHALLARRAEVVADPGWIELHLRLDEVDVAVRRAGLDLDPGHLSFLGCVLRFVYA